MAELSPHAPQPPLVWANVLMFALTFAAAAVLVPWYGLTHGFSTADWGVFVFFLLANGMAITGGYHRLWAHRTYDAHWRLSSFTWCSAPWRCRTARSSGAAAIAATTCTSTTWSAIRTPPARLLVLAHRLDAARLPERGEVDFANIPDLKRDPLLAFQHRYYVPLACGQFRAAAPGGLGVR